MLETDFYLLLYYISDAKALRKMEKILDSVNSMRIQKSVYELQGDEKEVMSFMLKAESIIDKQTDVVSLFPLCKDDFGKTELFGQLQRHSEIPPSFLII